MPTIYDEYQNVLSDNQLKHLTDSGVKTPEDLNLNMRHQAAIRKQFPKIEPCYECKVIAEQLNLPI